jgi:hypothetical protein
MIDVKYLVIKIDDVCEYLSAEEINSLNKVLDTIIYRRAQAGKDNTEYLVVAKDWFGGGLYTKVSELLLKELNT